jgi:hypothetical protein
VICQTSVAILPLTLFVGGVPPKLAAQSVQGQSPAGDAAPPADSANIFRAEDQSF